MTQQATIEIPAPNIPAPRPAAAPVAASAPAPTPAPDASVPTSTPVAPAAELDAEGKPLTPAPSDVSKPTAPLTPDPADLTDIIVYKPTGDTGLDLALQFVGDRGFGPERPEIIEAAKGNFAPLEAALKGLGDKAKGYDKFIGVAKESYTRRQAGNQQKEKAVTDAITQAAGGVSAWNAIHAWVVANADDEQRESINAAFRGGAYSASAMTKQLADLYKSSGQSTLPPKGVVRAEAGAAAATGQGALDSNQFKQEVRKLEAKYGGKLTETQEYRDVVARRRAYQPR